MLLSVIVPVYNVEDYVENCIRSILLQDIPKSEFEVIVVNDGSTDKSGEIVENLAKTEENIIYTKQENAGVSSARNKGLEKARGQYILFVDSDDTLLPYSLNNLLSFARNNDIELLHFNIQKTMQKEIVAEPPLCPIPTIFHNTGEYINTCFFSRYIWHVEMWRFLFKHSLLKENKIRFDQQISMGEDQLFTIQAIYHAKKIAYTPQIIYNYLIRDGSAMNNFLYKHAISQLKTANKIKELLKNDKVLQNTETLFYQRFINIFVIYQYIDRILNNKAIKNRIKTINEDIKQFQFEKLYYIPNYPEEIKRVRIYNFNYMLYCYFMQLKHTIAQIIK